MPRGWAVAAWVTCGLVWSLGLATIGLAVAGRVPPQRFVTSFMALGPLFGMPAALLGARTVQRRRGHRGGLDPAGHGLAQGIAQTANAYAWLSVNRHGAGLPDTALATWVFSFAWMPYAACALAWLYAVPSLYWALGGTAGLETVGGAIEQLAPTRDTAGVVLGIGAASSRS